MLYVWTIKKWCETRIENISKVNLTNNTQWTLTNCLQSRETEGQQVSEHDIANSMKF